MELDQIYWQNRYSEENTPWDIGNVSPPLKEYLDQVTDKEMRILIPGAGKAYEAVYLHRLGFQQVFVLDWAMSAFDHLRLSAPDFPVEHLLCNDFFELDGQFDLVLEQTFFCAISPSLRMDYVTKMASLLPSGGTLSGLLFASPFEQDGPPFGGTENEYRGLFSGSFLIKRMEIAKNSILPRMNNELFFELIKK
jgi:methyl halide transferase